MPDTKDDVGAKDALTPTKAPTGQADPAPSPSPARSVAAKTPPVCPSCGQPLDVYTGDNPDKAGTGFCVNEGVRVPLKGG
jgi:hypothetical protein